MSRYPVKLYHYYQGNGSDHAWRHSLPVGMSGSVMLHDVPQIGHEDLFTLCISVPITPSSSISQCCEVLEEPLGGTHSSAV